MSGKNPPLSRPTRKPGARVDLDSDERTQEVEKLHHVDDEKLTVAETCMYEGPNSRSYEGTYDSRRALINRFPAAKKDYFEREAIILSQLNHENVVQFIGIRRHNDEDYYDIVTKFLEGGTLKALLIDCHPSTNPLSLRKALGYALDIARAMEYVHQKKFVHRDLNPGNVILTEQKGRAVVINFGQAIKDNINGLKGAAGINIWMAPEMMPTEKRKPCDRKVDVYSFSIVLWELVTSKIPYYEHYKSIQEIEEDIRTHNIRPRLKDVKIPEVAALLPSCWAAEAATRPEFSEIVTRLEKILHKLDLQLPSAPKTMSGSGEERQPSGPANKQTKIDPGQANTSGTPEEEEVANLPQIDPAGLTLKRGSIHKGPNAKPQRPRRAPKKIIFYHGVAPRNQTSPKDDAGGQGQHVGARELAAEEEVQNAYKPITSSNNPDPSSSCLLVQNARSQIRVWESVAAEDYFLEASSSCLLPEACRKLGNEINDVIKDAKVFAAPPSSAHHCGIDYESKMGVRGSLGVNAAEEDAAGEEEEDSAGEDEGDAAGDEDPQQPVQVQQPHLMPEPDHPALDPQEWPYLGDVYRN